MKSARFRLPARLVFRDLLTHSVVRRPQEHPGRELCTVYYTPVNHMDVLFANGSWLPFFNNDVAGQGSYLGREFAGRDAQGRRVFGLVSGSGMATHVVADSATLWQVPDQWTLEQASTVSVAYVLVSGAPVADPATYVFARHGDETKGGNG